MSNCSIVAAAPVKIAALRRQVGRLIDTVEHAGLPSSGHSQMRLMVHITPSSEDTSQLSRRLSIHGRNIDNAIQHFCLEYNGNLKQKYQYR